MSSVRCRFDLERYVAANLSRSISSISISSTRHLCTVWARSLPWWHTAFGRLVNSWQLWASGARWAKTSALKEGLVCILHISATLVIGWYEINAAPKMFCTSRFLALLHALLLEFLRLIAFTHPHHLFPSSCTVHPFLAIPVFYTVLSFISALVRPRQSACVVLYKKYF